MLLPALHYGARVISHRFAKFDAAAAFDLISRHGVTNVFLPPTALKMLRTEKEPRQRWDLVLTSVASGGESLGSELLAWRKEALGVTINEFYGQGMQYGRFVLRCLVSARPGAIGRAAPGHDVQIVDDAGSLLPIDTIGNIAVHSPDPVMFLGYGTTRRRSRALCSRLSPDRRSGTYGRRRINPLRRTKRRRHHECWLESDPG